VTQISPVDGLTKMPAGRQVGQTQDGVSGVGRRQRVVGIAENLHATIAGVGDIHLAVGIGAM